MPVAEGPYVRITTATSTQVLTGKGIVKKIVVLKAGTTFLADFVDNTTGGTPVRFSVDISGAKEATIVVNNADFRTGIRVVTTGTGGEFLVYYDLGY